MLNHNLGFDDERNRVIVNLHQHYEVWVQTRRAMAQLPYGMKWKTINGTDYLYALRDRQGSGTSIGPRNLATEQTMADFGANKITLKQREETSRGAMETSCRIYQTLRLPLIAPQAAEILREADRRSLLGSHLIVVGTNAMAAYSLEATMAFEGVDVTTDDFEMAWVAADRVEMAVVWPMLKSVDNTYTVNTERPFQARNSKAYEFELLCSPSRLAALPRRDQPRPYPLPEQEWLLNGRFIDHVVVARDGSPARLVVPDPRWFALQKAWLSEQEKRNPAKRPKDARQAQKLLDMVARRMPQFPLDEAFEAQLPAELKLHFASWRAAYVPSPKASSRW